MKPASPQADVVIIGGGVIGLSTALELALAGLKVTVLERAQPGRGSASWAGGGILSALPPGNIEPEAAGLLEESLALYPQFCAQLADSTGIDPQYWRCGLDYTDAAGTVHHHPDVAQVRNPRLLKSLRSRAEQLGVDLRLGVAVQGLEMDGDRLAGVRLADGRLACRRAVIAAGAWSGALAPLDMQPVKGQMLLLRGQPGLCQRVLLNDRAYVIPRRDGRIVVGSTLEHAGFDDSPTVTGRLWLLEEGRKLLPGLENLSIEDHWAGLRPRLADGLPLIGASEVQRGVYYNTGHFRLGISLAPASARRLARVLFQDGL